MYQVRDAERKLLLEAEVLPYVRYDQKSQAWVKAEKGYAQGLVINGQIYAIEGRYPTDKYPAATIFVKPEQQPAISIAEPQQEKVTVSAAEHVHIHRSLHRGGTAQDVLETGN